MEFINNVKSNFPKLSPISSWHVSPPFSPFSLFYTIVSLQTKREREREARNNQNQEFRIPSHDSSLCSTTSLPRFYLCLYPKSAAAVVPKSRRVFLSDPEMVLWFFGYGSLVWNPGFEVDEKVIGFIKDYRRVFDLACIDHRGTPQHPARTCTLEYNEGAICWGAAYCVRGGPEKEKAAMEYLERRECEYDQKTLVDFYKEGESEQPFVTGVMVFTSTPDKISNKYYLGPAPLEDMAWQIATAFGPCGNNRDYLFLLEKAMFDIGHEDDYVIELANEVRKVLVSLTGLLNESKLSSSNNAARMSSLSPLKLKALPEAIAMDS